MDKQTIKDYEIAGKQVLLRVDYNVPIEAGRIRDTLRVEASLPTIEYLLAQNCRLVLISHLGRPEGKADPALSLAPVAEALAKMLNRPVEFISESTGDKPQTAAGKLRSGEVILLENLRFDPREEAGDDALSKELARLGEVFVEDAFAAIHRSHASISGVPKYLPAVAGLLVAKEVSTISSALESPKRPLTAMIGGAKVSDKIKVLKNLLTKVDTLVIGGAMANTFLSAQGLDIGKSVYEPDQTDTASKILGVAKTRIILPEDALAATSLRPPAGVRTIADLKQLKPDEIIADIGPRTLGKINDCIKESGTVIWNGPFGLTEIKQFATGSLEMARCLADAEAESIIGGGDTADFIDAAGLHDQFDLVSTGGGAALELMAGQSLPGLEVLLDR